MAKPVQKVVIESQLQYVISQDWVNRIQKELVDLKLLYEAQKAALESQLEELEYHIKKYEESKS